MSIGNLNTLFTAASASLKATQAAINATADNVANQNTAGYTRRVASFQDSVSLSGVSVSVAPQRDSVLDQRLAAQVQISSAAEAKLSVLNDLQHIFAVGSNGTTGISDALNTLWSAFSSLEASPSDPATRQGVLNAAANVATQLNSSAHQIASQHDAINSSVSDLAEKVNDLSASIADLNGQIIAGNDTDGTLATNRQAKISELSTYVGLSQVQSGDGGVTLSLTDGTVLVSESNSFALSTSSAGGDTVVFSSTGRDITTGMSGGQLGGLLNARDGQLKTTAISLDQLASALTSALNTANAAGIDSHGNSGAPILSISNPARAAASIAVAMSDPSQIAAASPGEASGGNGNANKFAALQDNAIISGETAGAFLASLLSALGAQAASASSTNDAESARLTQMQSQRDALSGVSLDEEAANLTAYQRAYQASARVFAVADALMAAAINLGQDTPVS